MLSFAALCERLNAHRVGRNWTAKCPAHEDHNPSLSLAEGRDGILLFCHAGCGLVSICDALGIEPHDLFYDSKPGFHITALYDYVDETGALLFQVVRLAPKDFRQRRPDGNGGWIWSLDGTRRVLYGLPELRPARSVLIVEGEKDVATGRHLGLAATCNPSGAGKWRPEYSDCLIGKHIVIIADADEAGRKHAQEIAGSLYGKAKYVKVIEFKDAKDLSEWVGRGGTREALLEHIKVTTEWMPPPASKTQETKIILLTGAELIMRDIKPREMLLDPVLPEQGLVMLYSYRGIGKTFLSLGMACAVAGGGHFLRWKAPRPRNVLYIDGELPLATLQQRLKQVLAGLDGDPEDTSLRFITPDVQPCRMPDLATREGQLLIEPYLPGIDLVVLDNLSALCREGSENDSEDWTPVQEWALDLRRQGICVLFDHHAGKNGSQRGTSRHEDLLDISITLKHPADYDASEGLRCEVHFEKTRAMLGDLAKPFEVKLTTGGDGQAVWTMRDVETAKAERAAQMYEDGASVKDVMEDLDISRAYAYRLRKNWQARNGNGAD